jgi:hypothetical protein
MLLMTKRLAIFVLFVAGALALPTSLVAADAADAKKPKTTKIRHVGTFDDMPGSEVRFTLVKEGAKFKKAVNVQVTNVSLFCSDGNGHFSNRPFSTTFPNMKVGRALGVTGFAVSDIRLPEFTWGYKSVTGFIKARGKRASGDARIRFDEGEGGCGGQIVSWTSTAR